MQWCNFYFQGVELHVLLNKPLQLFFMPSGIWFIYRPSYYLVNFGVPLCSRPLSIHVTLAWWFVQQGFKEFVPNHNIALFLAGFKFYAYIGGSNDAFQFNWFPTGTAKWRSTGFWSDNPAVIIILNSTDVKIGGKMQISKSACFWAFA